MRRWLSCICLGCALLSCGSDDDGAQPRSLAELASRGPFEIARVQLTLTDHARPTAGNGTSPGAAQRSFDTFVWHPADLEAGPFPIVAYSHSFFSLGILGEPVHEHLASHGYIVVAPNHPLSSLGAPGGLPTLADYPNQPADLDFAMTAVSELTGELRELAAAVDPSRRGVFGHSMGGGTALLSGHHPAFRFDTLGAIVAHAPPCFFNRALYADSDVPTLIIGATADLLSPFEKGAEPAFSFVSRNAVLARLIGGTHGGFMGNGDPDAFNSDLAVCGITEASFGILELRDELGAESIDLDRCASGLCRDDVEQTMSADRQLALTNALTLAHFDAELRGDPAARAFTIRAAGEQDDVEVRIR